MRSWIARRRRPGRGLRPCTQLCVDMALEAGMPKDQIEAVLRRDPRAVNSDTVLGFRFADAVAGRRGDDDEYREAVRTRRAVRDGRPAPTATPDSHARLLTAFIEAVASGDPSRLAGLLREDAIAMTDGGGRKQAALNPIMGADRVARFFIGVAGKNSGRDMRIEPTMINGTVGALLYIDGEIDHSLSMAIDGDRIAAIYIVRNPDKLRRAPISTRH